MAEFPTIEIIDKYICHPRSLVLLTDTYLGMLYRGEPLPTSPKIQRLVKVELQKPDDLGINE